MNRSIRIAAACVISAGVLAGFSSVASALKPVHGIGDTGTIGPVDPPPPTTTTTIPKHHPIINLPPNVGVFEPGNETPPSTTTPTTTPTPKPTTGSTGSTLGGANDDSVDTENTADTVDGSTRGIRELRQAHGATSPHNAKALATHQAHATTASSRSNASTHVWLLVVALMAAVVAAGCVVFRRRRRVA